MPRLIVAASTSLCGFRNRVDCAGSEGICWWPHLLTVASRRKPEALTAMSQAIE